MRRYLLTAMLPLLLPLTAAAQGLADYDYENLSFRGVGFDYGRIWPSKVDVTPLYSVRLDLGYLGPGVRIAPTISYWSSTLRRAELDRLADRLEALPALRQQGVQLDADDLGKVDWSDVALGFDAQFVWTAPLGLLPFVGANVSLHALNGRGDAIEETFIEDLLDSTAAGGALFAGVEYPVFQRLRLYGEARFTMLSDISYPGVRVGAAIMLPAAQGGAGQTGGRE